MDHGAVINPTSTWRICLLATGLAITCLLTGCDSGPPPPLPPGADLPAPEDRSRFEPEIMAAFDAAQERVRELPDAANWCHLGRVYHAHDQLDDAIACYRAAVEADDETNRTAHLLALALDELGDRPARRAATVISTVTAMPTLMTS